MPPDSPAHRTRLSWRRTTLLATVVVILLMRLALHEGSGVGVIGVAALCWVALLVIVQRRLNTLDRPAGRIVPLTAAACVLFGVLGVVLALGH